MKCYKLGLLIVIGLTLVSCKDNKNIIENKTKEIVNETTNTKIDKENKKTNYIGEFFSWYRSLYEGENSDFYWEDREKRSLTDAIYDGGVSDIKLGNIKYFEEKFNTKFTYQDYDIGTVVLNKNQTEYVGILGREGEIVTFSVKKIIATDTFKESRVITSNIKQFKTEKGLYLGMSIEDVLNILGEPVHIHNAKDHIDLSYYIEKEGNKYIGYSSLYIFKDNKLHIIYFGYIT